MSEGILTDDLRQCLISRLRELEPWMQINAVHEMVDRCSKVLDEEVQKQQPFIATAKKRSSFLSLPPELRTRIYELLVIPHEPVKYLELDVSLRTPRSETGAQNLAISIGFDRNAPYISSWELQPAITKVCRQMRKETLPVYYSNEFIVHVDDRLAKGPVRINEIRFPHALKWLRAIGPENRSLLTTISIKGGTLNYRWVSAKRFLAIMEKQGIDDLPEGIVRSFHLTSSVNQFGRAETKWIEASQETEAFHSDFGDDPEAM